MVSPVSNASAAPAPANTSARARYVVLAMLILAYTFNFVDRQILGILKEPIKRDLGVSDTQLGLMGGLAFGILYSTVAVPVAWLADRASRTWIMTGALAVWSGFTMLCGAATGFWSLFLARVGVGLGEAGGVAPAYSLVSDYFPPSQRARALAAYSFGIPVGSALGILFGGLIAARVDWRAAFLVVGGAGVMLAPVFKLLVRDPVRGGLDGATSPAAAPPPRFRAVLRVVGAKPTFWLLALGATSASICGYGLAFWLPSFFMRSLGMTLAQTSVYYGLITLIGGIGGVWLGGVLSDRFGGVNKAAYPLTPALCFLLSVPFFYAAMNSPSPAWAFVLFLVPQALSLSWFGPVVSAIQHMVPAPMRSTANALYLLVNSLLGTGIGYWIFGFLSDRLAPTYGAESMRYALYYGLAFYPVAALLLYGASRRIGRDWVEAPAQPA